MEKNERIYRIHRIYRIKYLITLKNNISDVYSHKYMENLINSFDNLPLEETINMYNEVILIKSY